VSTAYLGLGGNLGDRRRYLMEAVKALRDEPGVSVKSLSSVYETKPVGVIDQPDFLNLVLEVETDVPVHDLLARCLRIESVLGRVRIERWGPRTIDIDVLWYDGRTLNEPDLVLPHPRMAMRAFVLVPLAEIAPTLLFAGASITDLAAKIDRSGLTCLGAFNSLFE
jgi:2-amino-4-hydroxy-6-hydroxymethyldihydropteridine diphosphokinase